MNRKNFWKIFKLPSPSELGMTDSKYDGLPMRDFQSAGDTSPTWEDWRDLVKKIYPIKYFFAEQMVPWIRRQYKKYISNSWYWIKCHTLQSYKYHILDLRQPKNERDVYRYGWIDSDTKMVYAIFNILNLFVKNEMPNWYCPSEEEVQKDASLLHQRLYYLEAKSIHYWWNVERKRQEQAENHLINDWYESRRTGGKIQHELRDQLSKLEQANKDKIEEMIGRLLKIRHALWT